LLASRGRKYSLLIRVKTLRNTKPIISRRILTATDPILWLADSNDNDVIVQKRAVNRAAKSPK
jgi:hypothetical protein